MEDKEVDHQIEIDTRDSKIKQLKSKVEALNANFEDMSVEKN